MTDSNVTRIVLTVQINWRWATYVFGPNGPILIVYYISSPRSFEIDTGDSPPSMPSFLREILLFRISDKNTVTWWYYRTPSIHPPYDCIKKILDISNNYSGRTGLSDHFLPIFIVQNLSSFSVNQETTVPYSSVP